MRTLMDIAKQSLGSTTTSAPGALAGIYNSSGVSSIRYGTVQSVSGEVVSILLEDTGELVTTRTSTPVDVGNRVALIKNGQNVIVYSTEEIMHQINNKISRVDVEYALSTSSTVAPSDGWSTTAPSDIPDGQYLWTRTVTYTQGGTSSTSDPVCITTDAAQGKTLEDITEQYYLSTSRYTQSGGSWQDTCPEWQENRYIWTRSKLSWSDESTTYTTPVLATAINQANEEAWNATQYFWYDSQGAHVSTSPRSTDGKNALLSSAGLRLRDGSTVEAQFSADLVTLCEGFFEIQVIQQSGHVPTVNMGAENFTIGEGYPSASGWSDRSAAVGDIIEAAHWYASMFGITRKSSSGMVLPGADSIIPMTQTVNSYGDSLIYTRSNYVRITMPEHYSKMLVRVSAGITTNTGAQTNVALSVYISGNSSFSSADEQVSAIQAQPSNGLAHPAITDFLYECVSNYTYFWLVGRSSNGIASLNPSSYNYMTIEFVRGY